MSGKRATIYGKLAIIMALVLVVVAGVLLATVREAKAIPAWARKYNADCAMCHYPVVPRLNSFGHQFRRAGYRTPDEFNKEQDVSKVGDFLSVRARARFGYENKEGGIERSEFTLNDATFFYAGALTKNFSAFVESGIESTGDIEMLAQLQGVFGSSDRYVSIRAGQMHPLQRAGFGGFDRPTGISTNPLHSTTLTTTAFKGGGTSFSLATDQKGIEVAYVLGRSRLLAQVLNGLDLDAKGTATKGDIDPMKDYLVAYEHIWMTLPPGSRSSTITGACAAPSQVCRAAPASTTRGSASTPIRFSRSGSDSLNCREDSSEAMTMSRSSAGPMSKATPSMSNRNKYSRTPGSRSLSGMRSSSRMQRARTRGGRTIRSAR